MGATELQCVPMMECVGPPISSTLAWLRSSSHRRHVPGAATVHSGDQNDLATSKPSARSGATMATKASDMLLSAAASATMATLTVTKELSAAPTTVTRATTTVTSASNRDKG